MSEIYAPEVVAYKDMLECLTESIESNQKTYTQYAKTYDDVYVSMGYALPRRIVGICLSEMKDTSSDRKILDVAAGTGLVSNALRQAGFKGIIDALDGSKDMMEASKYKNNYRNITIELLTKGKALPFEENTYDAVICAGAMSKGHVPHECLKEMMKVLKPGGVLQFNASKLRNDPEMMILKSVARVMGSMVDEGICKLIKEEKEYPDKDETDPYSVSLLSIIYCYRKL